MNNTKKTKKGHTIRGTQHILKRKKSSTSHSRRQEETVKKANNIIRE
jgi:hypothetical protein